MSDDEQHLPQDDDRLKGWKEIAQWLRSSERTVQRWEHVLRLPVHRVAKPGSSVVLASRRELTEWLASIDGRTALSEQDGADLPIEAPAGRGVTTADGASGETPAPLDDTPESPAASARLAATGRPVWRRFGWIALGLGVVGLVAGYGPLTRWVGSKSSAPAKTVASTTPGSIPTVVVRLTVGEGEPPLLGIQVGGTSTVTFGNGATYVFSADLLADRAQVRVSRLEPANPPKAPRLIQLAVVALRQGAQARVDQVPGLVAMEWVDAATLNKVRARSPR